jgi:hypothetical protein
VAQCTAGIKEELTRTTSGTKIGAQALLKLFAGRSEF